MKKIDRKELYNLDHTIIEWLVWAAYTQSILGN